MSSETKRRRDRFQCGERVTALGHRVADETFSLDFAEHEVETGQVRAAIISNCAHRLVAERVAVHAAARQGA